MNVSLTPELEELIRRKLASGLYKNAAEVRRKVAEGMAQARAGKLLDGEDTVKRLKQRVKAKPKKSG